MPDEVKGINKKELFLTIFKINIITFGGGYTIAPVIKNEFVDKRKLLNDEEIIDIIAISQSGPGALAVSTSFLTGYRLLGFFGGLVALAAAILPPLIVISILFLGYQSFNSNIYVRGCLKAMSGAIGAILLLTSYELAKQALKKYKIISLILIISSFAISYFTNINTIFIILSLALLGLFIFSFYKEGADK